MKQLKRLLLAVGFIPVTIIGGIRWIITGQDSMDFVLRFEDWCLN